MNDWELPAQGPTNPELILPVVEPLGDGFATISWPQDKITAHLEGMWRSGARFETILRIVHKDFGTIHALTRINLLSTSARTDLTRALDRRYPGLGWQSRIDGLIEAADKVYRSEMKVTRLGERPSAPLSYLMPPILETNRIIGIAADPGTGKSLLGLAIGLHIGGHGPIIPGFAVPPTPGNTVHLDWEDDDDTHTTRLHAILKGAGKAPPPLPVRHLRMQGALTDSADRVIRICRSERPALVIIDSVGSAVVGRINDPEYILPLMDVCRALKTTVLILGHLRKEESDGRMIGSIFWLTVPRQAWHLAKDQEEGESETRLVLNHKKTNNGILRKPIGFRVEFENDGELMKSVRYYSTDVAKDPRTEKFASAVDRIERFLLHGRASLKAVADETGLPYDTVQKTVQRHEGRRFVRFGPRGSRDSEWGILSGHSRTVTGQLPDSPRTNGQSADSVRYVSDSGGGGSLSSKERTPPKPEELLRGDADLSATDSAKDEEPW